VDDELEEAVAFQEVDDMIVVFCGGSLSCGTDLINLNSRSGALTPQFSCKFELINLDRC
jgi:hypothetical protein